MAKKDTLFLLTIRAQRGSTGPRVKEIQDLLNLWALSNSKRIGKRADGTLHPDGIFGENTETAVMTFQRESLLIEDGVVGPFTYGMLSHASLIIEVPHHPKAVPQHNLRKCWAAATEYWLRRQPAMPLDQTEVIEAVRDHAQFFGIARKDAVLESGALTIAGQKAWENRFRIRPIVETGSEFFVERAATRLRRSGRPLMLGTTEVDPHSGHMIVGHVRVIIAAQADFFSGNFTLALTFMDPLDRTKPFQSKSLSDLRKASTTGFRKVLVTWADFGVTPT